jgi:hypothetical protein
VRAILEEWLAMVKREKGTKVITIRTDNAMEFKAQRPWAAKQGIQFEFIEPDTPPPREVSSRRIRRPTQAAIEARETEVIYGQKPRTQRHREEREAVKDPSLYCQDAKLRQIIAMANLVVAMELYLSDHDAFRAREEVKEQIPIPKTYQEAVSNLTYGTKWKEAI